MIYLKLYPLFQSLFLQFLSLYIFMFVICNTVTQMHLSVKF